MTKPTIALDFDGVIRASYYDEREEQGFVAGAREALQVLSQSYRVIVFSCRCLTPGGSQDIWNWLIKRGVSDHVHAVTEQKPDAVAYVDDKAVEFRGDWQRVRREIRLLGDRDRLEAGDG